MPVLHPAKTRSPLWWWQWQQWKVPGTAVPWGVVPVVMVQRPQGLCSVVEEAVVSHLVLGYQMISNAFVLS